MPLKFTLVATAKNEGPYLLEWVAHHRMIGFENILLFQNDSDDLTAEIMTEMAALGLVQYRNNASEKGNYQIRAYKRAARQEVFRQSDWALPLDLDEFLFVKCGDGHLNGLMDALPEADEILLNWRRFGNGGQVHIPDELVTEAFVKAEATDRIVGNLTPYKAMFRPSHFHRAGVHRPPAAVPEDFVRTCNGSGLTQEQFERFRFRSKDPKARSLAQVNHYIVRDAASFVLKSTRGSAHQDYREIGNRYWRKRNFNDEEDRGLAGRAPALFAAVAEMDAMSNGRLGEMRAEALARHRHRFRELLTRDGSRALYEFCGGDPEAVEPG